MKLNIVLVIFGVAILLSSCGLTKKDLGLANEGPDETKVIKKEALILPPEFNVRPNVKTANDNNE